MTGESTHRSAMGQNPQSHPIEIALCQPDIAGNTGTVLRTAACLGFRVHVIAPTGFDMSDRALKRAGMDYLAMAALVRHDTFAAFDAWRRSEGLALTLLTTKAAKPWSDHDFRAPQVILFGSESRGVADSVHERADNRIVIPMQPEARSLNLAVAVGIFAAEAVRQKQAN